MTDWWVDVPAPRPMTTLRRQAEHRELAALPAVPARLRAGRPLFAAATGLSLVAVTAAGVVIFGQDDVTDTELVQCHTTLEPGSGADFTGTSVMLATEDGSDAGIDDAVGTCATLWRQGVLRAGEDAQEPVDPPADEDVPPLTLCVTELGQAAVFPGEAVDCASLGLLGAR